MSSILRALKKLDEDSMSPEGQTNVKMRRMVNRRAGAPRVINLLSISLAILLLAAAAVIVMKSDWKQPVTKKQGTSPKKTALTPLPQQPARSTILKKELKKEPPGEPAAPVITVEPSGPSAIPASPGSDRHPEFILNGILWSHIPGRRVALINNHYLKEGDDINGVSVIRIEKKAVTLQSGAEKWTIKLKK